MRRAEKAAAQFLTDQGWVVYEPGEEPLVRSRDNNGALQAQWDQVHAVLRMSADMAEAGAVLTIVNPFAPHVDPRPLARAGLLRMIDAVLGRAVVRQQPERLDANSA